VISTLVAVTLCTGGAVEAAAAGMFEEADLYPTGTSAVTHVVVLDEADLVVLENGVEEGFRTGVTCRVMRDGDRVAEIVLAAVLPHCSVGLITDRPSDERIQPGDWVEINTRR
jgi:hypothetical protein